MNENTNVVSLTQQGQEPNGCRWIDGDPRDKGWRYCQKPVVGPERVWCEGHRDRVFRGDEGKRAA